ncbi:hypothetical protein Goari_000086, partial [Gossypium aridum]|nr:hypothetical protein [Gossypium aridum]
MLGLVRLPQSTRLKMTITRFDIDKFDGITDFNLWQVRMTTILIQSNLEK